MIEDAKPHKKVEDAVKKDSGDKLINKPEKASKEEIDNTNAWAQAEATQSKNANKDAEEL